ncbi:MAG TPA: M48 family metallopeptidase [Acidobacteriota bacterium]|nr:M48 family metallopeptidase [Acidobacteriota bacterium]
MLRVLLLLLALLLPAPMFAQNPPPPPQKQVSQYTLSPERYEKAVNYAKSRYRLYFVGAAYGLVACLLIIALRWSAQFRDIAERLSSRRFVQALIFAPLLVVTLGVLQLPLDLYGQSLALHYEQSVQGWGSWFWDWTKGQLIAVVLSVFLAWILYGVIRRSPARWWFYFWLASLPIIVFLIFIAPLIIEPLFFKFVPLDSTNPALVTEIEKVVQRGGMTIPRDRMFEMKASEKLKSVNAYVTGFGASKRVVVWDTTIVKMTAPQTLFVFGHEMGHYVLKHIPKTIAFIALILLIFLFLGSVFLKRILARWGARWQIRGADDWASLPVLMLLFGILSFIATPVFSTYSRFQEHQADIYGLEVIHGIVPDSPQVASQAFQILGDINLSDPNPGPFIKIWLYDHPPIPDRVVFAQQYDPWSSGKAPEFVK